MRILYWVLGAAAAAMTASYLLHTRSERKTIRRFVDALDSGRVTVRSERSSIPEAGVRQLTYRGLAEDTEFVFTARTDKIGTRWTFILTWLYEPVLERWDALKGERERSLAGIHLALKRLPVRQEDL